ncbi:MAG: BlaI/MecI/CopY family transcriptional regulator [Firmicutes bacterium]|nr:BlaI/MecI/CopY family transcriptional regulator [Bacillota bacterium]
MIFGEIKNFFIKKNFNNKEIKVLQVLWNSKKALCATEIADTINEEWALASIQNTIKSLLEKEAITVDHIDKIGKTYGRYFKSTFTADDYAYSVFSKLYNNDALISAVSMLLGKKEDIDEKFLNDLEKLVKK